MSEEGSLITEAMIKKATYLIHKLADQRNEPFETIRSKCKKMFGYMNLAKLSYEDAHAMISKLIEVTDGEEEQPQPIAPQLPTKPSEPKREITKQPAEKEEETKTEEDVVTATMREAIRAAVDITMTEVVNKDVPVMGLGGFVLDVGKVIFEAKMSAEDKKHGSK